MLSYNLTERTLTMSKWKTKMTDCFKETPEMKKINETYKYLKSLSELKDYDDLDIHRLARKLNENL